MLDIFQILPQQAQLLYGIIAQGQFAIDKENHQVTLTKDYFYDKTYIEECLGNISTYEEQYLTWYRSYYDDPSASMPIEIENFFEDIKKLLEQTIDQL
jgi:hypothetical protein